MFLLDINSVLPSAYRTTEFSLAQITDILAQDFLKWAGSNGVDYQSNNTVDTGSDKLQELIESLDTYVEKYEEYINYLEK